MTDDGLLGRYFEDFESGYEAISPRRTITEHDIVAFAGLSGDFNPLHTDALFAAETGFGQRIAHGMLGASIATGLAARLGMIEGTALAFLGLDWKFRRPILIGDTVHLTVSVKATRPMRSAGGGIVTFSAALENQRDEVVQRGEWTMMIKSRIPDDTEPNATGAAT